jgi:hypothetical protein
VRLLLDKSNNRRNINLHKEDGKVPEIELLYRRVLSPGAPKSN